MGASKAALRVERHVLAARDVRSREALARARHVLYQPLVLRRHRAPRRAASPMRFAVVEATPPHMAEVRHLFREYQQGVGVDLCFQGFEQELADLPGRYAPPLGALFLALVEGQAAGCVGIRPYSARDVELKRLYVRAALCGQGFGRRLLEAAMSRAEEIGYAGVVLETLPGMQVARRMYWAAGFRRVAPCCADPIDGAEYYRYRFARARR